MIEVRARKHYDNKYREGFPLLLEDFVYYNDFTYREGEIFTLVDQKGHFIASGYFGRQNKGIGWLLSWKEHEAIDRNFFMSKLVVALNRRVRFYQSEETTCYRVFNGEGDGIGGLTIDCYDDYYLFNWYSEGIYAHRDLIIELLSSLVAFKGIYEKKRFSEKGEYIPGEDFVKGEPAEFPLIVKESGVNIAVNLDDGPMTGVFLDQRDVRKKIRDWYSQGKTVLNTFSYTGVFSVFALMGGAAGTESVDLAKRSLPMTKEQMTVNGLDPDKESILVMDVFDYFDRAKEVGKRFDLVVLDPPSYARSKKVTFSAAKDYAGLVAKALDLTAEDGVIVASTNHSGLKREKFWDMIVEGFKARGEKPLELESMGQPEDFRAHPQLRESDYLKVFFVRRK